MLKSEIWNSNHFSHVSDRNPTTWAIFHYFSRCISRKLDWEQNSQDLNQCTGIISLNLSQCATMPFKEIHDSIWLSTHIIQVEMLQDPELKLMLLPCKLIHNRLYLQVLRLDFVVVVKNPRKTSTEKMEGGENNGERMESGEAEGRLQCLSNCVIKQ